MAINVLQRVLLKRYSLAGVWWWVGRPRGEYCDGIVVYSWRLIQVHLELKRKIQLKFSNISNESFD